MKRAVEVFTVEAGAWARQGEDHDAQSADGARPGPVGKSRRAAPTRKLKLTATGR
jgi:hypothetical protein